MKNLLRRIDGWDLLVLIGAGLVVFGFWDLYPPARWIVLGGALAALGVRNG